MERYRRYVDAATQTSSKFTRRRWNDTSKALRTLRNAEGDLTVLAQKHGKYSRRGAVLANEKVLRAEAFS